MATNRAPGQIWTEWLALCEEYQSAKEKHGEMTMDGSQITDLTRLAALMEEVGEAAEHLTYDKERSGLYRELIQVANVAMTWARYIRITEEAERG